MLIPHTSRVHRLWAQCEDITIFTIPYVRNQTVPPRRTVSNTRIPARSSTSNNTSPRMAQQAQGQQVPSQLPRVISDDEKYTSKALELWKIPVANLESNNFYEWEQALMAMIQVAQLKWTVSSSSPPPSGLSEDAKQIILNTVTAFIRQKTNSSIQYKVDESTWKAEPETLLLEMKRVYASSNTALHKALDTCLLYTSPSPRDA